MVFREDFPQPHDEAKKQSQAQPHDRLVSSVLDLAFLFPVVAVFIAPLQKQIFLQRLVGEYLQAGVSYFSLIVIGLSLAILYQCLFWFSMGATPGQWIIGLRVRSMTSDSLTLQQAFSRSLCWWLQVLSLGIPFLSVYVQSERRPVHDRIAETKVVSLRGRMVLPPNPTERLFFSTLQSVGCFFLALLLGALSVTFSKADWSSKVVDCDAIESTQKEAARVHGVEPSTLEAAMALYASDELPLNCLKSQAQQELWKKEQGNKPLAYLAMAFANMNDASLSNKYYEKVCAVGEESSSCLLSRWMLGFEKGRESWGTLAVDREELSFSSKIWAVRFANRMGHFEQALQTIDKMTVIPQLSRFLSEQRIQALQGLGREQEAFTELQATTQRLPFLQRAELLAWYCYEEVQVSCEKVSKNCDRFLGFVSQNPDLRKNERVDLAEYKLLKCRDQEPGGVLFSNMGKRFRNAVKAWKEKENLTLLKGLAFERDDTPFVGEARTQLLRVSVENEDLLKILDLWKASREVGKAWDQQTLLLTEKLLEKGFYDESVAAAELYVLQRPWKSHEIAQRLAKLKNSKNEWQKKKNAGLLGKTLRGRMPAAVEK